MKCSLQNKNGKYYVVVNYKSSVGIQKQKWVSTGLDLSGNKTKAIQKLKEVQKNFVPEEEMTKENQSEQLVDDITFCDFLDKYLPTQKNKIEMITYHTYSRFIHYIKQFFKKGKIKLKELKPYHLENFYNHLTAKKLSGNSIIRYHALIRKSLQFAYTNDFINSNPADKVVKPKRNKYKANYYNMEEIEKLFDVIRDHELKIPIYLSAIYGFRRSEVLGLKWNAIDFKNKTIEVKHKVLEIEQENGNKRIVFKSDKLKTESSNRILPLLPQARRVLEELRQRIAQNKKILGKAYLTEDEEYVCVDNIGRLILPNRLTENFVSILKKHKLKHIRFHDLRHSCASVMIANDVGIKQIQEWLGHSNFATTANIYTHLDYSSKIKSGETMANAFKFFDTAIENQTEDIKKGQPTTEIVNLQEYEEFLNWKTKHSHSEEEME